MSNFSLLGFRVELLAFLTFYAALATLYRTVLIHDPVHKEYFELICVYASRYVIEH